MAIIGILASVAMAMLSNMSARARVAKAQNDVRVLADAVTIYMAHMGVLPNTLNDLTAPAVNNEGRTAGPFLAAIPTRPAPSYGPYTYVPNANNTFTVSITGDGTTVSAP